MPGTGAELSPEKACKPAELCPEEHKKCFEHPENYSQEQNLAAAEAYCKALVERAKADFRAKLGLPSTALSSDVVNHLRKVAAKEGNKELTKGQESLLFSNLKDKTKKTAQKYAKQEVQDDPAEYAKAQEEARNEEKTERKKEANPDLPGYQDLVKARIAVYKNWITKEPSEENKLVLHNTQSGQYIIVTPKDAGNPNAGFNIKGEDPGGNPISDETIGIMLELVHNTLRFSGQAQKVKVTGAENYRNLREKIEAGFGIINAGKTESKIIPEFDEKNKSYSNK